MSTFEDIIFKTENLLLNMYSVVDLCRLCLITNKNIKSVLSHDSEGTVIEDKCRFLLNEHVPIKSEASLICLHCLKNLNYVYKFKQMCLQNIHKFNNYVDSSETNKHLKISLKDTIFQKENKLKCDIDNKSANEISSPTKVVIVQDEIADNSEIREENVSEEKKEMYQDNEFSGKENPEDDINMHYRTNLCEDSHIEHFLKKVKMETGFKIVHEEFHVKDEQVFEPTDSASHDNMNNKLQNDTANNPDDFSGKEKPEDINNDTNMQYTSSICEDSHIERFIKKVKMETGFKIVHEEFHVKNEQLIEPTDSALQDISNDKLQNDAANNPGNISTSSRYSESNETSNNSTQFDKKPTYPRKCDICNKAFSTTFQQVVHKRIHTGERPYKCDVCQKSFCDSTILLQHKRIHTEERSYDCDVCKKSFNKSSNLVKHKRIHTGERPYECDVCKKSFSDSTNLVRHKRVHTGEKPFECNVCQKSFTQSHHLVQHKRIHTEKRPYECDVCKRSFNKSSHLVKHKRIHTEERPYECDICKKSFSQSNHLVVHKRIHTGERPYECDVCKKSFSQSNHLVVHKRIHTGERPYECDVCQKSFNLSLTLVRHKRVHTGAKPYEKVIQPVINSTDT